jgi:uncharacterized protein YacL
MYEIHVNYIAILVVAVISFLIGAVWYSPVMFAKQWIKATNKTEDDLKKGAGTTAYIISFIAWLIASYVLAVIIDYSVDVYSSPQFLYGILAAFLCWFGFVAATSLVHNLFAQRPTILWLIDSGYVLVALLISGAVLAEWR